MNFSVDTKEFKENLIRLREDLNKTLEDGRVRENFQENLGRLEVKEESILWELLPYYRLYGSRLYPSKVGLNPMKIEGGYQAGTYLTSYGKVDKETYFFAGWDQKAYFARILDKEEAKIELSPALANFPYLITHIQLLDQGKILAFTIDGKAFLLTYGDPSDFFEAGKNLNISQVKTKIQGLERLISLGENKFLCQIGRKDLLLVEFKEDNLDFSLNYQKQVEGLDYEITSLVKTSSSSFVLGTAGGDLLDLNYGDQGLELVNKERVFSSPIKKLELLEDSNGEKKICGILGNHGDFVLYDWADKEITRPEGNFQGQLFHLASQRGTAFILTEDGLVYLLEENLGHWEANEKVTLTGVFLVNLVVLDSSNYLALDLDGNFFILNVDRLDSIEKLHAMDLY